MQENTHRQVHGGYIQFVSCPFILPIQSQSIFFLEMSIGKGKGRVPWAELQRARDDYIEAEYLPKDVSLKQYYHLRQEDVNAMLEHWAQRQAAGEVPFLFKEVVKAVRQNVRMSDGTGSDGDAEPSEEEDLQNSIGTRTQGGGQSRGDGNSNSSTEHAHSGQSPENAAENPNGVSWCLRHGQALTLNFSFHITLLTTGQPNLAHLPTPTLLIALSLMGGVPKRGPHSTTR